MFEWDYRLRELVEIATEDVRSVVNRVASPIKTLAVAIGRIERFSELFDTLL